jgi:hypothetical protein
MIPFRKHTGERTRGQAMVEFALVLPILALLLVMAIDFGRVFFGWVSLTNSARIGANYAGQHPNLLTTPAERDEYEVLVGDAVTGCQLNPANLNDAAYDPLFTDMDADGKDNGWGDHATVTLACQFDLITPLAEVFFGNQVRMAAEAVFPVRVGTFAGPVGGGGGPPNPPCTQKLIPDLLNRTLQEAQDKWVAEGFLAANFTFSPSTAAPDYLVNSQTFTPTANVQDCVDPTGQFVHVTTVPPPPCPSGQAQVPDLIGLLVADAKLAWTGAGFTGDFNPNNAVDSKTVLTQVTNPVTSPPINGCVTITAEVTITYGDPPPDPCDVPNLIAMTKAEAEAAWTAAGFTTTLSSTGPNGGTVYQQTPNHPGTVSCGVSGNVRLRN